MTVNDILTLDNSSTYEFVLSNVEEWERCYFQEKEINDYLVDELPFLDEEFSYGLFGAGEFLTNSAGKNVFDPFSEIKYEFLMTLNYKITFKSTKLIKILQEKLRFILENSENKTNLIKLPFLELLFDEMQDTDFDSIVSELEYDYFEEGCDRLEYTSKLQDNILWFSSQGIYSTTTRGFYVKELN